MILDKFLNLSGLNLIAYRMELSITYLIGLL